MLCFWFFWIAEDATDIIKLEGKKNQTKKGLFLTIVDKRILQDQNKLGLFLQSKLEGLLPDTTFYVLDGQLELLSFSESLNLNK
jgi:hypothetical protein